MRIKGITMIILGAMMWGATGPLMEWLLNETVLTVNFMLALRLTIAGLGILAVLLWQKKPIFAIWTLRPFRWQLIIFSLFGMLGLQYSFVAAINESNAVIATLLQFLAPIFIIIYVSVKHRSFPPRLQVIAIIGTLFGLFLLLTNGQFNQLLVSNKALVLGVLVGVTFAIYTLYPARLMQQFGVLSVVGWAMLIGGVLLAVTSQVWNSTAQWQEVAEPQIFLLMLLLILFGTIAFILFLNSTNYISPVETSILSSVEPLTAMAISVLWFQTVLQPLQLVGVVVMLLFVTWLSIAGDKS